MHTGCARGLTYTSVLSVLLLLTAASAAEDDARFARLQGTELRWYYNHAGAPPMVSAERTIAAGIEAGRAWAPCGVTISYSGETTAAPGIRDGVNVVGWGRLNRKESDQDPAGLTIPWQIASRTIEVDIALDPRAIRTANELRFVLMHQFGHAIGLGHLPNGDSVMRPSGSYQEMDARPTRADLRHCEKLYR
jgi:hypothetical protein